MNYEINGVTVGEIWDAVCAGKPVTFRFVYEGEIVGVVPLRSIYRDGGTIDFAIAAPTEDVVFSGSYPNGVPTAYDDGGGGDVE